MGFLNRMYSRLFSETRSSLENPSTPLSYPAEWLLDIFNGGRTDSGIRVSEMTALQVGTVFACTNIISSAFSSLPLHTYQQQGDNAKRIAREHNLYDLLRRQPNPEMTSSDMLRVAMTHALLWGNFYGEIERDPNTNRIVAIWPRNPAKTRPVRLTRPLLLEGTLYPTGTLVFECNESVREGSSPNATDDQKDGQVGAQRRIVLGEDMLHVKGLSLDGRLGQDVIQLARQAIGLALATEKYGAKFFGNGARPAGILTLPTKMDDPAVENLRRSWAEAHGGENQFKVAVLENGVKFEKIAATPNEGQMLESRQYQREEICAIFNVPLHMVAAGTKGLGKSNVEQSSIEFVQYCLNPWIVAFEQEFERKLFPRGPYFPKFEKRMLLYPDATSRAKFYIAGRQNGYLSADDVRELEDLNPIGGAAGQGFYQPTNMNLIDRDGNILVQGTSNAAPPKGPNKQTE